MGQLDFHTDERTLRSYFEQHGEVESVKIIYDHETRRSRGFAFVTFEDPSVAASAADATNRREIDGRVVRCNVTTERPMERGGRGGVGRAGPSGRRSGGGGGRGRDEEDEEDDEEDDHHRHRYGSRDRRRDERRRGRGSRRSRSRSRSSRSRSRSRETPREGGRRGDRDRKRRPSSADDAPPHERSHEGVEAATDLDLSAARARNLELERRLAVLEEAVARSRETEASESARAEALESALEAAMATRAARAAAVRKISAAGAEMLRCRGALRAAEDALADAMSAAQGLFEEALAGGENDERDE